MERETIRKRGKKERREGRRAFNLPQRREGEGERERRTFYIF